MDQRRERRRGGRGDGAITVPGAATSFMSCTNGLIKSVRVVNKRGPSFERDLLAIRILFEMVLGFSIQGNLSNTSPWSLPFCSIPT